MYSGKILVLRTCTADMRGTCEKSSAFVWPTAGFVEATDWDPDPTIDCGAGLHGLPWGNGDWSLLRDVPDSKWLVVEVDPADIVPSSVVNSKHRFRRGVVIFCGDKAAAVTRVMCGPEAMARAQAEAGTNLGSGDRSQSASAGYGSKSASAGDWSKSVSAGDGSKSASAGYGSQSASAGDWSKSASAGDGSKSASAGDWSKSASAGDWSKSASAGDGSQSVSAGYGSKSVSAGDGSKSASAGDGSKSASAGDGSQSAQTGSSGIAAAIGNKVRAKAGPNGLIVLTWWDNAASRYHAVTGEIGLNGIEADTWYVVRAGKLEKAE